MGEQNHLKCPCCEKDLEITHRGRYQDVCEHVSSPDSEPSFKDGYQCVNKFCIANNFRAAWIEDGSIYIHDLPENFSWTVAHRVIEKNSISRMYWALNSWNHYYQTGQAKVKKLKFKIKLGKIALEFEPRQKGYKYSIDKQYMPSMFRWKCTIWKKEGLHSYVHVIPFWRMMRHSLKKFHKEYSAWKANYTKKDLEECFYRATSATSYGAPDTRFYAKMTSIWLHIFYPKKTKDVIFDYTTRHNYHLIVNHLGILQYEYIRSR